MAMGRELRDALLHRVVAFSQREVGQFGAPSLITRNTNDVQQVQMLVQMSATIMVSAPMLAIGGIIMAIRQDAGLSWLMVAAVPVLLIIVALIVVRMVPAFTQMQARIDHLATLLEAALEPPQEGQALPEPALASMQPADMREAWYAIRLVYERPDCAPHEGTVVSQPTRPFQMAGFFDPDAPARPIRIGLPVDISPNGLRKFDKNTAFMLSDMLCGQIDRMKGIGLVDLVLSVLPWPFHKDLDVPAKGDCKTGGGLSLGVMCSLSIPIVTIAAMILLIIIVSLLDFVFRWMPFLVACFPLTGFKGRK